MLCVVDSDSRPLGTMKRTFVSTFATCGASVRVTASVMSFSSKVRLRRSHRQSWSSRRHEASILLAESRNPPTAALPAWWALAEESTWSVTPVMVCETASWSSAARRVRSSIFAWVRTCATRSS